MSEMSGISQCGQYPRSLFKSDNEIVGIQSASEKLSANEGIDQGRGLLEDKVTLSATATEIAEAQLKQSIINDPAQSVSNTTAIDRLYNPTTTDSSTPPAISTTTDGIKLNNNSLAFDLASLPAQNRSRFYTVV